MKQVKVTLEGSGQSLISDYTKFCIRSLFEDFQRIERQIIPGLSKIKIEALENCEFVKETKYFKSDQPFSNGLLVNPENYGEFGNFIEPGSGEIFILELIEMSQEEIDALQEFEGW